MFWQEVGNYLSTKKGGMPRWLWICIIIVTVLATIIPGILHFVYNFFSEETKSTVSPPISGGVTHDVVVTWDDRQTFWNITGTDASGILLNTRFPTLIVKKGDSIHFERQAPDGDPSGDAEFCILDSRQCWANGTASDAPCYPEGVITISTPSDKNCVKKESNNLGLTMQFNEARNYYYSDINGVNRGFIVVLDKYITEKDTNDPAPAEKDASEYDNFVLNIQNLGKENAIQDLLRRRGLRGSKKFV